MRIPIAKWKIVFIVLLLSLGILCILVYVPNMSTEASELPVMTAIGFFGTILMVIAPLYLYENFSEGKLVKSLGYSAIMLISGFALVIAWLWG